MLLRRLLTHAASRFDATVGAAMLVGNEWSGAFDPSRLLHEERMLFLSELRRSYENREFFQENRDVFFQKPESVPFGLSYVRSLAEGGVVTDAAWPSKLEPFCADIRDDYLGHTANRTAAARLFLHARPRPLAILVHGYRCGHFALEERIWPVRRLVAAGMDVALYVLPFHAQRATITSRIQPPPCLFPNPDPRFTVEGFRQAILDIRTLAAFARSRGAPAVGVMGMSLGGYVTGLAATVDDTLDFAAPIVPCASLADVARAVGLLIGSKEEQDHQHEALEAVLRVTSPLARKALVEPDRIVVVGGHGDRITPLEHAKRMALHFGAALETFHGGHLLQFGRAEAFRAIERMLERVGIVEGRG